MKVLLRVVFQIFWKHCVFQAILFFLGFLRRDRINCHELENVICAVQNLPKKLVLSEIDYLCKFYRGEFKLDQRSDQIKPWSDFFPNKVRHNLS